MSPAKRPAGLQSCRPINMRSPRQRCGRCPRYLAVLPGLENVSTDLGSLKPARVPRPLRKFLKVGWKSKPPRAEGSFAKKCAVEPEFFFFAWRPRWELVFDPTKWQIASPPANDNFPLRPPVGLYGRRISKPKTAESLLIPRESRPGRNERAAFELITLLYMCGGPGPRGPRDQ